MNHLKDFSSINERQKKEQKEDKIFYFCMPG